MTTGIPVIIKIKLSVQILFNKEYLYCNTNTGKRKELQDKVIP